MLAAIRRRVMSLSLPAWVLMGAAFGTLVGIFLGEGCAVLKPIGSAYVMMLQAVVYPYIICSLVHGLGRLSPAKSNSVGFYVSLASGPAGITGQRA